MKRFLNLAVAAALVSTSFVAGGCVSSVSERIENRPGAQSRYDDVRDPCWPERYNFEARKPVIAVYGAHVNNGHIMDQTVVNGDFEAGTDKLTAGALQRLDTLARRRPVDGHLFLAKSRDLSYEAIKPAEYTRLAGELDAKRVNAITAYLNATTSGRNLSFDVTVIDPAEQLMPAAGPAAAYAGYPGRFQAGINAGGVAAQGVGGTNATANVNAGVPGAGTGNQGSGGNQPQRP